MLTHTPWSVNVTGHPGSTAEDIGNEPDWSGGHQHRIGFKNRQDRVPGLTHAADDDEEGEISGVWRSPSDENYERERFDEHAKAEYESLRNSVQKGELVNFRDIILNEEDFHLHDPDNRSLGWRYVLDCTEDWVKNTQKWPANIKRKEKEEAAKTKNEHKTTDGVQMEHKDGGEQPNGQKNEESQEESQEENDWKRKEGGSSKHHDAYAVDSESDAEENQKLLERYTPQEIALLRALQHEKDYRSQLQQNDGKGKSSQHHNRSTIAIDEQDQFSPDNWLPRSEHLIRLTGKHPLNAEAELTALYESGLITPNELHYVRNHGAVPRLLWEFHKIEIEGGKLTLSMDDLKHGFDWINIPVSLACDGNRRKELNMIKKSKGFNWGSGATGCAYWKGPLLRDVLRVAGVKEPTGDVPSRWVNFEGADELSEGKYATCIPLAYAMDPSNDVILAYEMNDVPLPPDHGYPVRLIIPGYVGGRCVKWLKKVWVSDHENTSHYHIWDNRVLPSFITEKDGEFATTMFRHPDTACNEQNLNSVIAKPAQGEKVPITDAQHGKTYRIEGYAYDGGGHEVQRVEVSLDGGTTWLYCIRSFPDYPVRHGKKFWTWLHWHIDISVVHLLQAQSISVRAWNVFKNTQPERPSWNIMGMMNNCWYVVKPEISQDKEDELPHILFRHPTEPGTGDGGWMLPSVENRLANATQNAGAPQKQFTREEIEKHDNENDCWLVVDNKVYDATSVLAWHPGGKAALLGHAGKVHQETSTEFASIHDDFAYQKLKDCILGAVTEKAANFIKVNAQAASKERALSKTKAQDIAIQKHKWVPVVLQNRKQISEDTRQYTFGLPDGLEDLGLDTCQHIQLGFHLRDKMLIRSYTPTKPLLPNPKKAGSEGQQNASHNKEVASMQDGKGTFELVVKTYFPTAEQPGGAMSNILDCMPIGEQVEIRGPTGEIMYEGNGKFVIEGKKMTFKKISLVLGGSGITPGYALLTRALLGANEDVHIRVVDANKSEKDILLRKELHHLEKESKGRLRVTHILSHPSEGWKGSTGHVDATMIKQTLFPPEDGNVCFLCGPPAMIQKAALPALKGKTSYT